MDEKGRLNPFEINTFVHGLRGPLPIDELTHSAQELGLYDAPRRISEQLKEWGSRDYVHAGNWTERPDTVDISGNLLEAAESMDKMAAAIRRILNTARKTDPGTWTVSDDSIKMLGETMQAPSSTQAETREARLIEELRYLWYNGWFRPGTRYEPGTEHAADNWLKQMAGNLLSRSEEGR